uniref:Uncharacterized protein n=1 Tax=Gouania willdenowi TaxID=441366 RepID=A0A8C5GY24_GOUWI
MSPRDVFFFLLQLYFNHECKFKETLLANNYNAYESMAYPRMFIGLSKNGKTKRGNRVSPAMTVTHFLPRSSRDVIHRLRVRELISYWTTLKKRFLRRFLYRCFYLFIFYFLIY